MLGDFINWWRQRRKPSRAVDAAPVAHAAAMSNTSEATVQPWRLVRRRPLIGRTGGIAGWDLQLPAAAAERIARPGTARSVRDAHLQALLHAARCVAQSDRTALLAAPGPAIIDTDFLAALPPQTILRLGAEHEVMFGRHLDTVVDRLLQRRIQVATTAPRPGTIGMIDATQFTDRTSLLSAAHALSPARSARIAINLLSFEDLSALISAGYQYCAGAYQHQAQRPQRTQLSAPVASAAAALAAVVAGKPTRELAIQFKSDPTLSYRLLRTVNSVAFGLSRPADSIQDALTLLGSKELYRWLTALLITSETDRPLAPALYETALTRARLCELIAVERGSEPPEALFVTGAFSLLDVLLDVPLEVPLASARLSESAVEALIGATGPWRPHLDAAVAHEKADLDAMEEAAQRLALTADRIAELGEDAATWAHHAATTISESSREKRPESRAASIGAR
jgi:EAL and modified HD-GYP domain-containing signal transduction protein